MCLSELLPASVFRGEKVKETQSKKKMLKDKEKVTESHKRTEKEHKGRWRWINSASSQECLPERMKSCPRLVGIGWEWGVGGTTQCCAPGYGAGAGGGSGSDPWFGRPACLLSKRRHAQGTTARWAHQRCPNKAGGSQHLSFQSPRELHSSLEYRQEPAVYLITHRPSALKESGRCLSNRTWPQALWGEASPGTHAGLRLRPVNKVDPKPARGLLVYVTRWFHNTHKGLKLRAVQFYCRSGTPMRSCFRIN